MSKTTPRMMRLGMPALAPAPVACACCCCAMLSRLGAREDANPRLQVCTAVSSLLAHGCSAAAPGRVLWSSWCLSALQTGRRHAAIVSWIHN